MIRNTASQIESRRSNVHIDQQGIAKKGQQTCELSSLMRVLSNQVDEVIVLTANR